MDPKLVSTVDGKPYILSDNRGDMSAAAGIATGLYSFDTRYLNLWALRVNGERRNLLAVDELNYFETRFFLLGVSGPWGRLDAVAHGRLPVPG
ncbi:hypothetical protein ONA91_17280 [Micromonospora sp. DR5-3]|uniref:glycogen debranching N-terminal domain-containing protein n=1 Tax=unclassified Micromonospora TaxID=2617518 RepID=UPI0011D6895D|nr:MULTISPECIES: glycogen debranching N-terminal domain-containing protein [unclassified Micromonospora]MCW3816199.1 hypothetical protein [Micromonospora sp. DR5-3]TYC10153.1 hypothetical protein FXF52_40790 [Micromonospora sp. MP36]